MARRIMKVSIETTFMLVMAIPVWFQEIQNNQRCNGYGKMTNLLISDNPSSRNEHRKVFEETT